MNLIKNILSVLADDPFGEMQVSEIKAQVMERLSNTERIASNFRAARDGDRLQALPEDDSDYPVAVFDRLISHPQSGI